MAAGGKKAGPTDYTALLPTSILSHVFSFLPLRSAVLCGIVSKPWLAARRELFAAATCLDFGLDFAVGMPMADYARAVDGILALHRAASLDSVKLFFEARSGGCLDRVEKLLAFAASKNARALELELSVHSFLWTERLPSLDPRRSAGTPSPWKSLTRLSLAQPAVFYSPCLSRLSSLRTPPGIHHS